MIKIGQKVTFKHFGETLDGVVNYVHATHRWFNVRFGEDKNLLISFLFNDIGKDVNICEE